MKLFDSFTSDIDMPFGSLRLYVLNRNINEYVPVKFETSYAVFGGIKTTKKIIANYNLVVFGNLISPKADIKKNLYCLGEVQCDDLKVGGSVYCSGALEGKNVSVGGNTLLGELCVDSISVGKGLIVNGLVILEKFLRTNETIVVLDDIIGDGVIETKGKIITQACDVKVQSGEFVSFHSSEERKHTVIEPEFFAQMFLDDIDSLNETLNFHQGTVNSVLSGLLLTVQEIDRRNLELEDVYHRLDIVSKFINEVEVYRDCFGKSLELSEMSSITTIEDFIELLLLKKKTPKPLYKHCIVRDLLNVSTYSPLSVNLNNNWNICVP
jgi:cytoskeletal protein CcmA (bactofilin family)